MITLMEIKISKKNTMLKYWDIRVTRDRIPNIDILLKDGEIWKEENFESKIIYVPGHTLGHICFYFFKDKAVFTGDTLFSLGCGRLFEGTYDQMFMSLNKIKELPLDTKIFLWS